MNFKVQLKGKGPAPGQLQFRNAADYRKRRPAEAPLAPSAGISRSDDCTPIARAGAATAPSVKPASSLGSCIKPSASEQFAGAGEDEVEQVRREPVSSFAQIGAPEPEPVIPCANPLHIEHLPPRPDGPRVIDPAAEGPEAWEKAQTLLGSEDLGPPGLSNSTHFKELTESQPAESPPKRPKAAGFLRNAHNLVIGEAPTYTGDAVKDYGLALLRGMGYSPEREIVAKPARKRAYAAAGVGSDVSTVVLPTERPKNQDGTSSEHVGDADGRAPDDLAANEAANTKRDR